MNISSIKKPQAILIAIALGFSTFGSTQFAGAKSDKTDKSAKKAAKHESKKESKKSKDEVVVTTSGSTEATGVLPQAAKALADGDVKGLVALWTADGDYTSVDGDVCKGRDNLEKRFSAVKADSGAQQIEFVTTSVRTLAPTVVLAEGMVKRKNGVNGPSPETHFSIVLQKQESGNWLISSATETPLQETTAADPLEQLSWLIGEWSAEKNGGSVNMSAAWAPHKNFIVCTYQVKKSADAPVLESKQIIGWDPRSEQPISWHFDSNGGYGYGSWIKRNKEWLVEATGIERDGSSTSATNMISPSDSNNFTWQSVNRSLNGLSFNDTEALKVHRVK